MTQLLSVKNLSKTFGKMRALNDVSFNLNAGEINALCGANGAGKTTFLNLIMGFIRPTEGEIRVDGKKVDFSSAREALDAGISIVQQELSVIAELTVAENIYLGQEPTRRFGCVDFTKLNAKAQQLLDDLEFDIDASRLASSLSVAEHQLIEIAKALSHKNAKIIIFDEPTSSIGEDNANKLIGVIKNLASKGKGIIYVSHHLSEIFKVASNYTVFRNGTYIADGLIKNIDRTQLIEQMIGGELDTEFPRFHKPTEDEFFVVHKLTSKKFKEISFTVCKGEILGIYGLIGSGRSEFLNALFGIDAFDSGYIEINGRKLTEITPRYAIENGVAYVTEDRKNTGLFLSRSVGENITISSLNDISKYQYIREKIEKNTITEMIEKFGIEPPNFAQLAGNLSGGNQQKVVLSKWSLTRSDVLLLDEPTRGVDVGSKRAIYHYISEQANQGKCVILVSSELSEIKGMSDRIAIFKEGKLVGVTNSSEASQQQLLHMAS